MLPDYRCHYHREDETSHTAPRCHRTNGHALVLPEAVSGDDDNEGKLYLKKILVSYHNRTRSPRARFILDNFREELAYFWMVTPKDMKAPLNPKEGN